MKKNKSQISLFIIVGFVLLITISFFIFILTYTAKKQVEKEQKQAQSKESRFDAVDSYITSCLERTAKNALKLISAQGGVIYMEQGGSTDQTSLTENIDYLNINNIKIFAGIRQPVIANCSGGNGCVNDCTPVDPDCGAGTCSDDGICVIGCSTVDTDCYGTTHTCASGDGCGYWKTDVTGTLTLGTCSNDPGDSDCGSTTCKAGDGCMLCSPPDPDCGEFDCTEDGLCTLGCETVDPDCGDTPTNPFENKFTYNTPNYPWLHFPKDFDGTGPSRYISHLGTTYFPSLTVLTDNLKTFMKNNITGCISLTSFSDRFDIIPGTITTNSFDIKYTKKDTVITLNYPVNLKHPRTGDQATLSEFTFSSGLNLKGMHEHILQRITEDNRDLNYVMELGTGDYRTRLEPVGNDDIVVTTSITEKIDGIHFDFNFTRKNRKPALENLNLLSDTGDIIRQSVNEDDSVETYIIILNDKKHDPDEDIDCTAVTLASCDALDCATNRCKCVKATCTDGYIKLDCTSQTVFDFQNWKFSNGFIPRDRLTDPTFTFPTCTITIGDNEFEDYQEVQFDIDAP